MENKLKETIKKTKFTPPSPIRATPTLITSNHSEMCPMSVSSAGDVTLTSLSQNKVLHVNYSTLIKNDPPKGKTTAIIAVVRGKSRMVTTAMAVTSIISKN